MIQKNFMKSRPSFLGRKEAAQKKNMSKIWELYENMNEIVYVVDLDNYGLVYVNARGREAYGLEGTAYMGKKCYQTLQGCALPCAACENASLRPGQFLEWRQCHPVLGKLLERKCTVIEENGRRYRFELAIDQGDVGWQKEPQMEMNSANAMVNEVLRISLQADKPEKSILRLVECLGQFLRGERVYIFEETREGKLSNTYEWCANGVSRQIENLQNISQEVPKLWYQRFKNGENVLVHDVEDVGQKDLGLYSYLYPQGIQSLVVSPLVDKKRIIGFYGIDNPPGRYMDHISSVFQIVGHFIVSLLRRRNLVRSLEQMSYYDQLTEVGNRHAMHEYIASLGKEESVGVLYCDVMGLKKINDTQGHQAGDRLLLRACRCLKEELKEYALFRIGGDEFLVLCPGIEHEELLRRMEAVKRKGEEQEARMAVGCVWSPDGRTDLDRLIAKADDRMYKDKREYYEKHE